MPQMGPLGWLILYFSFVFCFYMYCLNSFFFFECKIKACYFGVGSFFIYCWKKML